MSAPPAKKIRECTKVPMVVEKRGQSYRAGMAPPEEKENDIPLKFTTISMVVEKWKKDQYEQFSAVHRINGYPWRLRLYKSYMRSVSIELICDKSNEAPLWMCNATIKQNTLSFNSWDERTHASIPFDDTFIKFRPVESVLEVEIAVDIDGERWRPHNILDPLEPTDGILVIGNEKINVHKASLASQSSFFDRLFFGNFKEKNMTEITIGDVEYEEFVNLLKIVYRLDGISLTRKNVSKVLHLAGRFDLKIVEVVCVNFVLSYFSSMFVYEKLRISEKHNLPFLKEQVIASCSDDSLRSLVDSPKWKALSRETTKALMKRALELVPSTKK